MLSCVQLFATLWTVACQAPLSMKFSRQEYWNGLPFPSPGDLPDPGSEPRSPALQSDSLPSEPPAVNSKQWSFTTSGSNLGSATERAAGCWTRNLTYLCLCFFIFKTDTTLKLPWRLWEDAIACAGWVAVCTGRLCGN